MRRALSSNPTPPTPNVRSEKSRDQDPGSITGPGPSASAGEGDASADAAEGQTSTTEVPAKSDGAVLNQRGRWWLEVGLVLVFYVIYSAIRNTFGSAAVSPELAYDHAIEVIDAEKAIGLYFEETMQGWFLDHGGFLKGWNIFYGTFHFLVTIGVLVWLFLRFPARHRLARNSLAATTLLALVGFSTYPLMPPRLLAVGPPYGGLTFGGDQFSYVDTLAEHGGLWSFDSGTMQAVSNQFAAMPSLHFGWSTWCLVLLWPVLTHWWTKALMAAYPMATLFAIIVTANHYWLDALGGALVLALGLAIGKQVTKAGNHRLQKRASQAQ